jgi:hypothetical protein
MSTYPSILWLLLGALLVAQATWIFRDARRRGEGYAWLWGLFGLINVPSSLIVYVLVTRRGNTRCTECLKSIPRESRICPYCGSTRKEES